MSVAWHVARRSCAQQLTYRGAAFGGAFTNTVFGFLRVYVLFAVLEARPGLAGFDATDAATYAFVTQGLLAVLEFSQPQMAERIRTGDIVTDLYRPVDFQGWHLATDLGRATAQLALRALPPMTVGAIAFGISVPPTPLAWLAFAASIVLAVVISFSWRFLVALTAFWLLDIRGVWQIASMTGFFLAGLVVPLSFFPPALGSVVRALPFAGMAQLPLEVYLGRHPTVVDVVWVLGRQAGWAVVLLALGRFVAGRAMHKVVVQGG